MNRGRPCARWKRKARRRAIPALALLASLGVVAGSRAESGASDANAPARSKLSSPLSAALWDSVAALRRTLGPAAGSAKDGACLRDEQEIEFYVQSQQFWTDRRLSRTLAIEDPDAWDESELGPDLLLPRGAQILRSTIAVLGPEGAQEWTGSSARRLEPAEAPSCRDGIDRLRLVLPPVRPHSLLRWELFWREPTATVRAAHWFGGAHALLESRFSFVFPKTYLNTDWGQFVRPAGAIPTPEVEDDVGPLQACRRFTYRARHVAPYHVPAFAAPLSERVPHLVFLPQTGGPDTRAELRGLCNRLEDAAILDAATRTSLLDPIRARAAAPGDRARLLRETVAARVRLSELPLQILDETVRAAPETWAKGCGTTADIAALLVAGLRELNVPARPLLARSGLTGAPDTTLSDPSEFDRILVEVAPAEPGRGGVAEEAETILDIGCPLCPWGFLRADLQGHPAVGIDHGTLRWRSLPSFPAGTNWMRRTVVMEPVAASAPASPTSPESPAAGAPLTYLVHVERTAFGELALRVREANGMDAPGGAVLPDRSTGPASSGSITRFRAPEFAGSGIARRSVPLRRSSLRDPGDLDRPVAVRDTMRFAVQGGTDGWRVPESILGHRGLLPGLEEPADSSRSIGTMVVLPQPFVLADSTVIVLPPGWTAASLPEPTIVQGAGFSYITTARAEEGRVILTELLAVEETRFAGARARDIIQLGESIREKDGRTVLLRRM